jgi:hypothetical protein
MGFYLRRHKAGGKVVDPILPASSAGILESLSTVLTQWSYGFAHGRSSVELTLAVPVATNAASWVSEWVFRGVARWNVA